MQGNLLSTLIVIKFYSFGYNVLLCQESTWKSAAIKWLEDMFRVGSSRRGGCFLHTVDNKLPDLELTLINNSAMI